MSTTKISFKEAIDKIKVFVGLADAEPAAAETTPATDLKEYTTDAGVIVKIDKLEAGGKVMQADGVTPVAGNITLSDGTVVAIDMAGIITAVTVPEVLPIIETVEAPDMAQMQALESKFTAFAEQTESLKTQLAEEKTAREKDAQKFREAMDQVLDLFQKFAEQPSDDPIQVPNGKTDEDQLGTKAARREAIAKRIAANQKAKAAAEA